MGGHDRENVPRHTCPQMISAVAILLRCIRWGTPDPPPGQVRLWLPSRELPLWVWGELTHAHAQGGPLRTSFFLLRTALKDRPKGPPTAKPPTATNRQSPTTNRHQPPTANRHQPPTANRHQPPTANRHQPPTATNHG